VFLGDGCLMEGISHEACSLAGTLGLGKLIAFYDDNGISIDGHVEGWFTDDTPKRFEAYGWQVIRDVDGHDAEAVEAPSLPPRREHRKPTLICCKTIIGKGSPNKAGTHDVHGAPLGKDEIAAARAHRLGITTAPSRSLPPTCAPPGTPAAAGAKRREQLERASPPTRRLPGTRRRIRAPHEGRTAADWAAKSAEAIASRRRQGRVIATRKASQNAIGASRRCCRNSSAARPTSPGSNLTLWKGSKGRQEAEGGNYLHYGVREFGMAAIMNGLVLHGGLRSPTPPPS
jgi:transketolase